MSNDPTRTASRATMPPRLITAVSLVPPPTSMTMLPTGSSIGRSAPMAAAIGCSIRLASAAPGPAGGIGDGPPLDLGDRRRHADDDLRAREAADADPLQQQPDHPLGDLEVGDRPAAQRSHGDDVAGRPPDHLPRLAAGRQHLAGLAVEGDHRRLVEHDAAALHVDERVRRPQVDGQVTSHRRPPSDRASRRPGRREPSGVVVLVELLDLVDDRAAGLRRERVDLAPERAPRRRGAAGAGADDDDDHDGHDGDHDDDDQQRRSHDGPGALIGVAPVPHALPSRQVSCFQIGTDAFSASMT